MPSGLPLDGLLFGDANDDGMVAGLDLTTAQQNFGNVLGSAAAAAAAAVPESTSACLLTLVGLGAMARRRRLHLNSCSS